MDWLKALLGTFDIAGFITRWLERRERDKLVVEAESAKRAKETLAEAQEALKERHGIEDRISRIPPRHNRDSLRKWTGG